MLASEFQKKILDSINQELDILSIRLLLLDFKLEGGTQKEAYNALEQIRANLDLDKEDLILEIMDIVSGFCSTHLKVW